MALEKGLVMLIQSHLGSPPRANGGFLAQLPKDYIADKHGPAYTYRFVYDRPQKTLQTITGFAEAMVQIDCYAADGPGVLALARAINGIHGFRGLLPDPESTFVDSCLRSDSMDFPFDPDGRNYRRMLEYTIFYANTF